MGFGYTKAEALEFGVAANAAEGLEVSEFFMDVAGRYVSGEISLRELHDLVDLHYIGKKGVSNELSSCVY